MITMQGGVCGAHTTSAVVLPAFDKLRKRGANSDNQQ
jgi:hypothetical protein